MTPSVFRYKVNTGIEYKTKMYKIILESLENAINIMYITTTLHYIFMKYIISTLLASRGWMLRSNMDLRMERTENIADSIGMEGIQATRPGNSYPFQNIS